MPNTYEVLSLGGVLQQYGPVDSDKKFPSAGKSYGQKVAQVIDFTYDELPTASALNNLVAAIPARSVITDVVLQVLTPFAGGTSYNIGLQTRAGVEIDNDGLFATLALASINTTGAVVSGTGALVPAFAGTTPNIRKTLVNIGANDGQVVVAATGTFTAGRARLYVEYMPLDDYAAQ